MQEHQSEFFSYAAPQSPTVTPRAAILLHRCQNFGGSTYSEQLVASLHEFVNDNDGTPVIGAGRLMTKEDFEGLLRQMLDLGPVRATVLPHSVVSMSPAHLVWTVPAKVRPMLFNLPGKPMQKLVVPWPRLLLLATRHGKLAVAALSSRTRPTSKTRLYRAPLMNVGSDGVVCTGTATLPGSVDVADMPAWESVLYDTAFSHVNNPNSLALPKKTTVDTAAQFQFWDKLSRARGTVFPQERMTLHGMTVGDFVSAHAR